MIRFFTSIVPTRPGSKSLGKLIAPAPAGQCGPVPGGSAASGRLVPQLTRLCPWCLLRYHRREHPATFHLVLQSCFEDSPFRHRDPPVTHHKGNLMLKITRRSALAATSSMLALGTLPSVFAQGKPKL